VGCAIWPVACSIRAAAFEIATVRRTLWTLLVFLGCCSAQAQTAGDAAVINREYTIKAAFLYHFSAYVEWPNEAFSDKSTPFVIGVFQTNPFGTALDQIAQSKNVAGRPIEIRNVTSADAVRGCHILFVPASAAAAAAAPVLREAEKLPILVVGETDDFLRRGGEAQFFLEGNKVRFAFDTDGVAAKKLKVSSKLLSLAKIVSKQQLN
jgi:hypothetical protein